MSTIKLLRIQGFKKFKNITIEFNKNMNVIVGDNEIGKSTILEAIKIVILQKYRNIEKIMLHDLFNYENVKLYKKRPGYDTLPKIIIEVLFQMDEKEKDSEYFYGENSTNPQICDYGIIFTCEYDKDLGIDISNNISNGDIPYECYTLRWQTFANRTYSTMKKPLNALFINTFKDYNTNIFSTYTKNLFNTLCDTKKHLISKNEFTQKVEGVFKELTLPQLTENSRFGIDRKKVILENMISVLQDGIPLENHGSGMESLIKTRIALVKNNANVILMEEPENHLSYVNMRQMLSEILSNSESQMIITTHSSMIATGLNLINVIWLAEDKIKNLNDVPVDVAEFFKKAVNNDFLALLLSKKIILVEGATEYMMIPFLYRQFIGNDIEYDGISVISCNGISYQHYLKISEKVGNKVAVITDNDGYDSRILNAIEFNEKNNKQHIFMGESVAEWTWEKCLYDENVQTIKSIIKIEKDADYKINKSNFNYDNLDKVLRKMLLNKVDSAYQIIMSNKHINIPNYVKEALKWIRE